MTTDIVTARVWDLPVRLFHWLLVALLGFSWWSGEHHDMEWHRLSGYVILALIVFNQPMNQLGEGQQINLAQRAQALATGALVGQLSQSIGTLLNVDLFEINAAPESGDAAQFTIGQQLGQNLYVKLQQGVGDHNETNFILEYELTRWLRLRTNVVQGSSTQQQLFQRMQGTGADLLFFFSY